MPQGLQTMSQPLKPVAMDPSIRDLELSLPIKNEGGDANLAQAFDQFTSLSAQLSESYQELENRVSELTTELGVAAGERVSALEQKERLADRLENLLNVLPAGVVVLDATGCITDCNPAALEMLTDLTIGESWRAVIQRCFKPQQDDGHEVSTFDGRKIHIATRSLDEQGQIVLLTDNTETRRLQRELNRQDRLNSMGKMVSALAHQIRTPLSAATLYAGHLCSSALEPEKQQLFSHKLLSRLHHLERQVSDMLLFAKGEVSLNDQVSAEQLQQSLADAIETTVQEKQTSCHYHNLHPHTQVRCNLDVLIGALSNLVNNAIQAMSANEESDLPPELKIELVQLNESTLRITVYDNGPMIDPQHLIAVQEAFVTTKPQGIGLGLAVVNVVANAHGGRFEMLARKGGGVSAAIHLPVYVSTLANSLEIVNTEIGKTETVNIERVNENVENINTVRNDSCL